MELNKIYNMDCLEAFKLIDDSSIDLVVTDPPYKIISGGCRTVGDKCGGIFNKRKDTIDIPFLENLDDEQIKLARSGKLFKSNDIKFSEWIPEVYRVLKSQTHFYVMCNDRNMQEMLNTATQLKFQLVNILAWKKNNVTPNRYYMKNLEFILMFRKGAAKTINNKGSKQCFEISNIIGNKLHPTEKPVELMRILIENSSNENEIVLDPFIGSGSTALACIELNRKYIGFEIDEEYYDISNNRIDDILP